MQSLFKPYTRLFAGIMTLPMAGCIALGQAVVNFPVHFREDMVRRDLRYGEENWHRMDIYYPEKPSQTLRPVIVFIHGGRWSTGNKAHYPFVAETLTRRGYIVAIPNYGTYPAVTFPAFVEDAARAIAWLRRESGSLQLDRNRIMIVGHSAGAHIGALLCADPRYLTAVGGSRDWITAFAGLAGPYSFVPDEPDLVAIFGPPARYPQMQVTHFIDGLQPPMLLLQGTDDDAVHMSNLEKMERAIRDKGGVVRTRIYYGVGHLGILTSFSWMHNGRNTIVNDIDRFFREQSKISIRQSQQRFKPAA